MTVFRYVDTAAAASGDGTTRNHSGATCAYDSLANAEADIDFDWANIAAVGDDLTVKCAGSAADTTAVVWDAFGSDATYTLTIQGDDGAADSGGDDGTAYDDDGRYTGKLDYEDTNYYRIENADNFTFRFYKPLTLSYLQLYATRTDDPDIAIYSNDHGNPGSGIDTVFDSLRIVTNSFGAGYALSMNMTNGGGAGYTVTIQNCIVTGGTTSSNFTYINPKNNHAGDFYIQNNTVRGSAGGARGVWINSGTGVTGTAYVANNAIGNTSDDIVEAGSMTVVYSNNATDDADEGGGAIALGTHTDEWVDPTGSSPGDFDFTPKSGGQLRGAADLTYAPALDINGATRSTVAPDIGAIEAASNNVPSPLSLLTTGVG